MLWNIKAGENLISGDFVEFIKDRDGELSCKKASELASISAIAARDIAAVKRSALIRTVILNKDLATPQRQSSAKTKESKFRLRIR